MALKPTGEARRLQRLAAEDHRAQGEGAGRALLVGAGELAEGRGGLVEHGDPFAGEQVAESLRGAADPVGDDDQAAAVEERAPDLPDREVEGVGMEEGPDVVGPEGEPGGGRGEQAGDVAVGDGHPLGPPGRAGGVDDVGWPVRVDRREAGVRAGLRQLIEQQARRRGLRQAAGERGLGDERRHP